MRCREVGMGRHFFGNPTILPRGNHRTIATRRQNHSHCILLQLRLIALSQEQQRWCGGIIIKLPGPLAHPRTRCQAQGVMQGALSTSTQAARSGPTNGRRESGCLPGQCKIDRMAALARTRLQVLVVASSKLTRACASRSDSRLLGNAGGSPTLSSSSVETPESLHVGVVKNQPPNPAFA
ncbi:hypothetical protein GGI35DRAFT_4960 [Trichoderma velutinum]